MRPPESDPTTSREPGASDEAWLRGVAHVSDAALEETMAGAVADGTSADVEDLPVVEPENYRVIGELAKGGMGRIFIAEDRRLRRIVALKELLAPTGGLARRFVDEAFITAGLQHPSIVPIHEAGRWPTGAPFYAMKLIGGRPLSDLIREAGGLAARLALVKHMTAVAEAVAYAHKRRVVHRDLKPANVIVGEFGETIVIDWGLAINVARDGGGQAAAAIVGTPAFMPPEQAAGLPVDARADVFALGAMLYDVLAGRPPYEGADTEQVLAAVLAGPPRPLRQVVPTCPEDLLAIVDKAMARRPEDRYPSALELAQDLERFMSGRLVGAQTYSTWTLVRRWVARHRYSVGVAAVGLIVLAVGGSLAVRRVIRERDRADAERAIAVAATRREAARVEQLTLAQAEVGLDHDPTATVAWLQRIDPAGPFGARARQLASRAHVLGVASHVIAAGDHGLVAVAMAADGKRVATGGQDGHVRVWSVEGADPRQTFEVTLPGPVDRLAFLADGRLAMCGGGEGRIGDGAALAGDVSDLAVAPDGRAVAIAVGGEVRVGDARVAAEGRPGRLAIAPDGAAVAWRDRGGVKLWSVAAGRVIALADGPEGDGSIVFSRDGALVAAGGADAAVVWETASRAVRRRVTDERSMSFLAFAPDGRLVSSGADAAVSIWDLGTGQARSLSQWSSSSSRFTLVSPDGSQVVATRDDSARVIDVPSGEYNKLRGHAAPITAGAFSADGRRLVIAALDGTARVYEVTAGFPRALRGPGAAEAGAMPAAGVAAAGEIAWIDAHAGQGAGAVPVVRLTSWQGARDVACGDAPPDGKLIAISGDGRAIAYTAAGGRVNVCDAAGGVRASWVGDEPSAMALSRDGSAALLGFRDGSLQRRRLADGQIETIRAGGAPAALALSPDGARLAWVEGETVRVREAGGTIADLPLPGRAVTTLAFGGGGDLVVGDRDGAVTVIDAGGATRALTEDGPAVVALDVSPAGDVIATLDAAGLARFFPDDAPRDPAAFHAWLTRLTNATINADGQLVPR